MPRSRALPALAVLVLHAMASAAPAADGHGPATGKAAEGPARDAVAGTPASAPAQVITMEDLRKRLQQKIAQVRAAQAPAAAASAAAPATQVQQRPGTQDLVVSVTGPRRPLGPPPRRTATAAAGKPAVKGARPGTHGPWGYEGPGGPEHWGDLDAGFATCVKGNRQSPIDIRNGIRVDLEPIQFDYRPVSFHVIDTGHTVQANLAPGNSIVVASRRYELVQFHFHRPSEESINGRHYEMVAHLVHKDAEGRLAVVAVLMDQGKAHPMVQLVWNSLPLERDETVLSPVPIDMNLMLPEDRRYYTYMGSLTTPPCTEGVRWMVLKQPASLSFDQIAIFARLYPMNARPIQQAGGRLIKESN